MNIIEAAEILNVRHDADHLVVKAAFHALAKLHHPDLGGDTATMQRVNVAYDYMSIRTQAARLAEWERLQPKPAPQPDAPLGTSGSLDELHRRLEEAHRARKAASSPSSTPPPAGPATRPWKPTPTRRERWAAWKRRQPWPARWALNLCLFLLIMAGRLAMVAGMLSAYAEGVRWAIKSLAHGWYVLLIIFPGFMIVLTGLVVTFRLSMLFLVDGWGGWWDFFDDTRLNNPNIKPWHNT